MTKYILNTDGGARGNPGPGAIGVVLKTGRNVIVKEVGKYLGQSTNNEAEYQALIEGLNVAREKGATELACRLDSELVVKQLRGEYKIKSVRLKNFYIQIKNLEKEFKKVEYAHVPRSQNKEADRLVNETLDLLSLEHE